MVRATITPPRYPNPRQIRRMGVKGCSEQTSPAPNICVVAVLNRHGIKYRHKGRPYYIRFRELLKNSHKASDALARLETLRIDIETSDEDCDPEILIRLRECGEDGRPYGLRFVISRDYNAHVVIAAIRLRPTNRNVWTPVETYGDDHV